MLNINFWNIAFTVINLLVLYLFLKHFLMKPLMEIMEKRQAQVETDLNDAARKLEQADRMIGLEREKTLRELQGLTKELAATAAEKLLKENSGREADRKRFAAFLADTGEKHE